MACRYEEEIFAREGKVEKCGCPECPYKYTDDCIEITNQFKTRFETRKEKQNENQD